MSVRLILRNKEYEVRSGMTLLDSLKKVNILSESVIATRDGEMILDDEILRDGDVGQAGNGDFWRVGFRS